jgi:hypothetical protein
MQRTFARILTLLLPLSVVVSNAHAIEILSKPTTGPLPNLVQVVSANAKCAAVSDAHSLLAIGRRPQGNLAGELYIFGLDAAGNIVGTPPPAPAAAPAAGAPAPATPPPPLPLFTVPLPRAASLAAFPAGASHMVFHPKLPLLYVWQDIEAPAFSSAKASPIIQEFDHLLIYSFTPGQPPKLEAATCRGLGFAYSAFGSMIALNPAATRVYLPLMRSLESPDNTSSGAVGYLKLDAATGLPVKEGDKLAFVVENLTAHAYCPCAMGYAHVSDTMVIFGSTFGPVTWETGNRQFKFGFYQISDVGAYNHRLIGHPTLPVVYFSGINTSWVHKMDHADGYLTMQPQRLIIEGGTVVSPPVFMIKQNKLAVGGAAMVHICTLDDAGGFSATTTQTAVNAPRAEGLAYSEKLDKLYVAVEPQP